MMSMVSKYELFFSSFEIKLFAYQKFKFNSGPIVTGPQTAVKNLELEVENTCNSRLDYGHEF